MVDDSYQLRPQLTISLSDNINAILFWSHYQGDEPDEYQHPFLPITLVEVESEFCLYGDSGGCFISYYF